MFGVFTQLKEIEKGLAIYNYNQFHVKYVLCQICIKNKLYILLCDVLTNCV